MFDFRKRGRPRTDEERKARHSRMHPGESLPPRGSGGGTGRLARGSRPRTDEERRERHSLLYPGQSLPPRGSGLRSRGRGFGYLPPVPGFGNFSNLFTRR